MTAMPQLVAAFHSLVGLAAVLVAAGGALRAAGLRHRRSPAASTARALVEMALGVAIGAITFTGSVIAFLKLDGRMSRQADHAAAAATSSTSRLGVAAGGADRGLRRAPRARLVFWLIVLVSFALGVLLIIPIGGADMPVVVSMLNSYSGWAAAGIGFTLGNLALIITGALVGSSGAILSYIMCKGMNRSLHLGHPRRLRRRDARGRQRRGGDAAGQAGLGRRRRLHHEERLEGHHRAGLRHGGGAGPARAARDGRPPEEGGRRGEIRHPPGRGPHARPHERAAGRGQRALRRGVRARGHQLASSPRPTSPSSSAPTT